MQESTGSVSDRCHSAVARLQYGSGLAGGDPSSSLTRWLGAKAVNGVRGGFGCEWTHSSEAIRPRSPWSQVRFQALWRVRTVSPNPRIGSAVLVSRVKRRPSRQAFGLARGVVDRSAVWSRVDGIRLATESVRGWAMWPRLFQLEGAEGRLPVLPGLLGAGLSRVECAGFLRARSDHV